MKPVAILSPAKINLTLDVFEKLSGASFHEIKTIYHKLNWGDQLKLIPSHEFKIVGNFDCPQEENLVYKSFLALQKAFPKTSPVSVEIQKNIPTQAGLGGGSSNAATFIKAYFQAFNLGSIPENLIQDLSNLGKDIPFFFHDQPCGLGHHFGEIIEPLDFNFSGQTIYLYFPDFKSETAQAYAQLKDYNTNYTANFLANPDLKNCGNGFKSIFDQKIYSNLFLTGSGSTFYSFKKQDIPGCKVIETTLA